MAKTRTYVLAMILALVCAASAGLLLTGIDLTNVQERSDELASMLKTQQHKMKSLYDQRSATILQWIDERAKMLGEQASDTDPEKQAAAAETLKKETAMFNAIKIAIEESQKIELTNQQAFDRFDRLQTEISNYVASQLIERLRQQTADGQQPELATRIREFEQLETKIANTRRDYHQMAFERRDLLAKLNDLPFGFGDTPEPTPVFAAEEILFNQAGR